MPFRAIFSTVLAADILVLAGQLGSLDMSVRAATATLQAP